MHKMFPAIFLWSLLFFVLCDDIPNSPLDENSPNFVKPVITLDTAASSLKLNDTIHFDSATLFLKGNMPQSRFQIKIDTLPWTSWKPAGAFPVSLLSDGKHTLSINTMYDGGIKIFNDSIVFFVKVKGFRPLFSPMGDSVISTDTGKAISFTVRAAGETPISYQWYRDTSILDGKTDTIYNVSSLTLKDTGAFFCFASNKYGIDTSRIFNIKFRPIKGGIKGVLVSSKNSAKLSGGIVTMTPGNVKDTSNSDGFFAFNHLLSGTYSITITLSGYQEYTKALIEVNDSTIKDLEVIVLTVNDTVTANLKVVYDGNGNIAGSVPVDQNSYKSGMVVTIRGNTGNLAKTGYVFGGWNSKSDGSGTLYSPGDTFSIGASSINLYAKWTVQQKLTITYNGNANTGGAVPVDSNKYAAGDSATVLGNTGALVKTGFSLSGWNAKADGSGTDYNAGSKIPMSSTSVTLFAKWTNKPVYSVIYNRNGADSGSVPAEGSYEVGASVTVSDNTGKLAKIGYAFSGWNTLKDGTGTSYAPGVKFTQDTTNDTLYAKWITYSYTVTYDDQSATTPVTPTTKIVASPATTVGALPVAPEKAGYTFGGWYTAVNGGGLEFTATTVVTASITVYAKWTNKPVYTVKFNSQGGGAIDSQKVNSGDKVIKPATDPTWAGHTFGGWYKESACINSWDFINTTVTADVVLFAKWAIVAYTVKFNSQGGSAVDSQKVNSGDKVIKPATDPTWAGHTFGGWYKESGCATPWDFTSASVTTDMTLFAKWTLITYTVKFNSQGGSAIDSQLVGYGLKVNKPADPAWAGHAFGGWYKESACTSPWDFTNMTVSAEMALFAKWTNTYTLTITPPVGGSVTKNPNTDTYISGATVTLTANPSSGYRFKEWGGDAAGTTISVSVTMTQNRTVTAIFFKQYKLTVNASGQGTVSPSTQVTVDSGVATSITATPNPGYKFKKWNSTNIGVGFESAVTATPNKVTLTKEDATVQGVFGCITFRKDFPESYKPNSVVQHDDGSYGIFCDNQSIEKGVIVKLNAHGDSVWEKAVCFLGEDAANPIPISKITNGFMAGGLPIFDTSFCKIVGISIDAGTTPLFIWNPCVDFNVNIQLQYAHETNDGGYCLGVYDNNLRKAMLIKTNSLRQKSWSMEIDDDFRPIDGQQTKDYGYVMVGGSKIIKINSTGTQINFSTSISNLFPFSVRQISEADGYIVGGDGGLVKISKFGDVAAGWPKTYSNVDGYIVSVRVTSDGSFVFLTMNGNLVKTNSNGDIIWNKKLSSYGQYLDLTSDGGFIITSNNWILKTDENGDTD
jgi:uncharacterized repeat protein (TIGR02543 family)